MRYLSVCSGIEAATVAWHSLGWQPVAFSEIEKFPAAVLAQHYPDVPNYGDMNEFRKWPDANVDVLVGGTPCQSFSVAGLRAGLADPRGNLALVYLAIAEHYRPRWLVWENVAGVLSSDGGRDFAAIVGGMVELGYCPAWRVLDAKYFGVPQRRRRVFIVASLGDWRPAAEVLFEPESLRGDSAPSRETGKSPAGSVAHSLKADGFDASEDGTGRGTPLVAGTLGGFRTTDIDNSGAFVVSHNPACTLTAREYKGPLPEADLSTVVAFNWQNGGGYGNANEGLGITEDGIGPLSRSQVQAVAFAQNQRDEVRLMDKAGALAAQPGAKQQTYAMQGLRVRRLTPRECERLQGFPDDYTLIPYRGKPAADGPRYKALGNSMAVPVMRWIGQRIAAVARCS